MAQAKLSLHGPFDAYSENSVEFHPQSSDGCNPTVLCGTYGKLKLLWRMSSTPDSLAAAKIVSAHLNNCQLCAYQPASYMICMLLLLHVTTARAGLGLKGINQVRQHPDHCRCTAYIPLCARKRKAALQAFKAVHMHICSKHLIK